MVCVKIENTYRLHKICQYYTLQCQFFAFNLKKIYTGQKSLHCQWQISGMDLIGTQGKKDSLPKMTIKEN